MFCSHRFEFHAFLAIKNRSDRIRTCDLYVPNVALYQAEPHSDKIGICISVDSPATEKGLEPLLTESESAVLPITPFRIIFTRSRKQHGYYTKLFGKIKHFF